MSNRKNKIEREKGQINRRICIHILRNLVGKVINTRKLHKANGSASDT